MSPNPMDMADSLSPELVLFLLLCAVAYVVGYVIYTWLNEPYKHMGQDVCPECAMKNGRHDKHCNYQHLVCKDEGCPHYGTPHQHVDPQNWR